jgi:GWxTD domain-containing protein
MLDVLVLALTLSLQAGGQEQTPAPQAPKKIAGKDLSELLKNWPDQYVRWIITEAERKVYESLQSDAEKLQFIEFFWARRDPDPKTAVNEFRDEYLERYAFVANYLSAGKPGWRTDRGRIYLILGPPHSVQQNPMGRYGQERPSEIWTYNNLDIPDFPASIDFQFVDFNGTGDFELVQDIDTTASIWNQFGTVNNALDAIAQRRLVIGEVDPRTGLDTFKNVDNTQLVMQEFDLQKQMIDVYNTPKRNLEPLDTSVVSQTSFGNIAIGASGGAVRGDGERARVPVQLTVPYRELTYRREGEEFRYELDYVVIVAQEDGSEVARAADELALKVEPDRRDELSEMRLAIDEVLMVPPGDYRVVSYVRDRNRNRIGNAEFPLNVPDESSNQLSLSSVFLAAEILRSGLAEQRPFQFGAVRVIPSASTTFHQEESLKLYVEAYHAAPGDDGTRRLRVDFFVMRDGRLFMGVPASYLRSDADPVGITGELPLRKCGPGDYVIRVRVTDEVSGEKAESETAFGVSPQP